MSTIWRTNSAPICAVLFLVVLQGCNHSPESWKVQPPPNVNPPRPYDVVTDNTNSIGATLNPKWGLQSASSGGNTKCNGQPYQSDCTKQPVVCDYPVFPTLPICFLGAEDKNFFGHADWAVAEYQGAIGWQNYATDLDYNFRLVTDKLIGTTPQNSQSIEMEMDSRELFDNFGDNPNWWWEKFALTADKMDFNGLDQQIHPSNPQTLACGAAIGVFNLDCDHGCRSEVHPIYALAIQLNEDPKSNDWAVLVRNWGDGGFCAAFDDQLQLQDMSLLLPVEFAAGPQKISVTEFVGTGGVGCPTVSYDSSRKGEVLRFALPPPESHGMAVMKVHMEWPDGAKIMSCPVANVENAEARIKAEAVSPTGKVAPEDRLRTLMQAVHLEHNPPQVRALMAQPAVKKALNVVAECNLEAAKPMAVAAVAPTAKRARLTIDETARKNNQQLLQRICEQYKSTNTPLPSDLSESCDWIRQHPSPPKPGSVKQCPKLSP